MATKYSHTHFPHRTLDALKQEWGKQKSEDMEEPEFIDHMRQQQRPSREAMPVFHGLCLTPRMSLPTSNALLHTTEIIALPISTQSLDCSVDNEQYIPSNTRRTNLHCINLYRIYPLLRPHWFSLGLLLAL